MTQGSFNLIVLPYNKYPKKGGDYMKKMTILVSLLAVLILGVSMATASGPALVINQGICGMVSETGGFIVTDNMHEVITNSENDNVKLTCRTQLGYIPAIDKTVHWDAESLAERWGEKPVPCITQRGITYDWKQIVTPSGKVMLSCHYKA